MMSHSLPLVIILLMLSPLQMPSVVLVFLIPEDKVNLQFTTLLDMRDILTIYRCRWRMFLHVDIHFYDTFSTSPN